jgi:hypothetical protein
VAENPAPTPWVAIDHSECKLSAGENCATCWLKYKIVHTFQILQMHNTINKHVFTLTLLPFLLHVAAHTVPPAHLNSHNAKSAQSELDVP